MNEEIRILQNKIDAMSSIYNAVAGESFRFIESDTLLILQRRMQESDLLIELSRYNEIFLKTDAVEIADIVKSGTAYIRIRCLVTEKSLFYTPVLLRQLIKDYKMQMTKVTNIIHLSKVNALTADDYQKETIRCTQEKNEAFLIAFQKEIEELETRIERNPGSKHIEPATNKEIVTNKEIELEPNSKKTSNGIGSKIRALYWARKSKQEIEERLRTEEKRKSQTRCEEIPFYDSSLVFSEVIVCKNIPAYSIVKKKNNIYFGLSKNVEKSSYNNQDHSLVELTKVTEEFIQYMTEDLLNGEFELKPFSENEKASMQLYFEFMTNCFERHIGVTLTVQEYLEFKTYYNKIVLVMFELERKQKDDYYRALILADSYISYMRSYDLECADSKEQIVANLICEKNQIYLEDIVLILNNHIVDEEAKNDLIELKLKIAEFHQIKQSAEIQTIEPKEEPVIVMPNLSYSAYNPQSYKMPVYPSGVMQIVVQILNQKHEVIDEALYAGGNIKQALYDYETKDVQIKRLGFRSNGTDIFYKEDMR